MLRGSIYAQWQVHFFPECCCVVVGYSFSYSLLSTIALYTATVVGSSLLCKRMMLFCVVVHVSGGTRQVHHKQSRTTPDKGAALGGTQTHCYLGRVLFYQGSSAGRVLSLQQPKAKANPKYICMCAWWHRDPSLNMYSKSEPPKTPNSKLHKSGGAKQMHHNKATATGQPTPFSKGCPGWNPQHTAT